jgi:zinc transport system permease protein
MIAGIDLLILMAGLGIAVIAGSLGCFVVWRKMAYFGDALSHSALSGIALGFLFSGVHDAGHHEEHDAVGHGSHFDIALEHHIGILLVALVFAFLLIWLNRRKNLSIDVVLGTLAHAILALGLIAVSFSSQGTFDFHDVFLGNMESIGLSDLLLIYISVAIVLGLLFWQKRALILITLSEDLAKAEGVAVFAVNFLFMALMALFVMVASQLIGILLVASLLIIPAASARQIARGYRQMVLWSWALGGAAFFIGLIFSSLLSLPTGATIVVSSTLIFLALLLFTRK